VSEARDAVIPANARTDKQDSPARE